MTGADGQRGSVTIETVILVPALLLFVALIIAAGRVTMARQTVDAAAAEAARAASLSRTRDEARARALTGGRLALTNQGIRCVSTSVAVDTSGFDVPVGTPASVTATVTCLVALGDVVLPGLPGTITVTSTVSSPLDTFRGR